MAQVTKLNCTKIKRIHVFRPNLNKDSGLVTRDFILYIHSIFNFKYIYTLWIYYWILLLISWYHTLNSRKLGVILGSGYHQAIHQNRYWMSQISLCGNKPSHEPKSAVHPKDRGHCAFIMTSSNGNIFYVTGPLCWEFPVIGEFPSQMPVKWSFDVFFDLHLNTPLSKQLARQWYEMSSHSLWRHCYVFIQFWWDLLPLDFSSL